MFFIRAVWKSECIGIGGMAFRPSGEGAFTPHFECFCAINGALPDGLKAVLQISRLLGVLLLNQLPSCFEAWGINFPDIYASRKRGYFRQGDVLFAFLEIVFAHQQALSE